MEGGEFGRIFDKEQPAFTGREELPAAIEPGGELALPAGPGACARRRDDVAVSPSAGEPGGAAIVRLLTPD
jgi:hypothetical protein